jgi:hypothetical protein
MNSRGLGSLFVEGGREGLAESNPAERSIPCDVLLGIETPLDPVVPVTGELFTIGECLNEPENPELSIADGFCFHEA